MANVIPFDTAKRLAAHAERLEQQRHELEEAGNHAWGRLKNARKLKADDRKEIAKAMHQLLEELKQRCPDLSMGKLAKDAGLLSRDLDSKELYRLTLPPGEDPIKRGLRADGKKYADLLKAIRKHTGENLAQLAARLTKATSLHPKQSQEGTEESERVANYLQEVINRIDLEFKEESGGDSLFETFMKTARIKTDLAKADKLKLRRPRWPYFDADDDDNHIEEDCPEFGPGGVIPNMPDDFLPRSDDDFDVKYAFWQRDYYFANKYSRLYEREAYASGVAHHDALMNLPRIYLGLIDSDAYFSEATVAEKEAVRRYAETHTLIQFEAEQGSRQRKIECLKSHVGELGEIRDPETGHAHIAHRHPKTGEWVQGLSGEYDGEFHWVDESSHVWLVIYPSPDNTTLVPVLYQPMEEGGTLLMSLNQRSLVSLKEMLFVDDAGEPRSLYDRIKELMRFSSDRAIYKAWQETAKDVLDNPLLRAYRKTLAKQDDFERGMAAIWDRK